MQTRNDQPFESLFNFGIDSVFNSISSIDAETPILPNNFLLLDSSLDFFLLLDGSDLLLLGT